MSYPSDFYATLVAAGTLATQSLQLPNQIVDSVYTDYDGGLSQFGQGVNIVIPTVTIGNASDIGNSGITGTAPADTMVSVTLNHKYASNRKIPDFDVVRSNPVRLAELYVQPCIEEVLQYTNNALAGLITAGNFSNYTAITGGADVFTRAHIATAWANLRSVGVPVSDGNLSLLTHPVVYGNMMSSSEFANESVVGINAAEMANRRGVMLPQFGALLKDDPQLNVTSGAYTAILMHKYAIALRVAVMAAPEGTAMLQTVVYPRDNFPVHVQMWWEAKDQAYYINCFALCGHAVARPTHGSFLVTT